MRPSLLRRAHAPAETLLLLAACLAGCAGSGASRPARPPTLPTTATAPAPAPAPEGLLLGIDVLERQNFAPLAGKRIGLLTHPAGVNRFGLSTIEVIRRDRRNNLVALFGVEHGIYGTIPAGTKYEDHVDERTGLTVHSLYTGRTRKPTAAQLAGLDVLVIDLQDIGSRSYTFISAMRLALEACFENDIEVVVLDRPNPLGGLKVAGPPMDADLINYLGAFQVPYVHGLTMGELARLAASEPGVLQIPDAVRRRGRLTIVPMRGWSRDMTWPRTGLHWVPTSPNIPNFDAVVGYPMTGLGAQIGGFRHGIGTPYPFRFLTHTSIAPDRLAAELNRRRLPGLQFLRRTVSLPAAAGASGSAARVVEGVRVEVVDWNAWRPTELGLAMIEISAAAPRNPFAAASTAQAELFNKHTGSRAFWQALVRDGARAGFERFFAEWERQARAFQAYSQRYWFYR